MKIKIKGTRNQNSLLRKDKQRKNLLRSWRYCDKKKNVIRKTWALFDEIKNKISEGTKINT